jgi:hypothetical protein
MWEVKAMANPHQQLLVGPSAAAETVKFVSNALAHCAKSSGNTRG